MEPLLCQHIFGVSTEDEIEETTIIADKKKNDWTGPDNINKLSCL